MAEIEQTQRHCPICHLDYWPVFIHICMTSTGALPCDKCFILSETKATFKKVEWEYCPHCGKELK